MRRGARPVSRRQRVALYVPSRFDGLSSYSQQHMRGKPTVTTTRKPASPIPTPFEETPAAEVDTTGMGGELTPFYACADAIGRAFLIHDILPRIETEYGTRMFVHVSFTADETPERYTLSFTEKAPAFAQLLVLADSESAAFPIGPVTLARKGKSYVVVSATANK